MGTVSATVPFLHRGFTLMETMIVMLIAGILAAVAIPSYRHVVEGQKINTVVTDLGTIATGLERFRSRAFTLPLALDELTGIPRTDPWGNEYQYLNFNSGEPGINGRIRKDHNLHPLNSEFDLYSMGPDGRSASW